MKSKAVQLFFILLITGGSLIAPRLSFAQAVPDTSLNNIIRDDSTRRAQDTLIRKPNTTEDTAIPITPMKPGVFQPNPKKAGLYSALVPGLGQLYNRQYWKVALIYAAAGVTTYFFANNYKNYEQFYKAYIGRINNPYPTDPYVLIYSTSQLDQLQNDYERYLDLTVLVGTIEYAIEVLDAVTSAHLKNFDISRDISMQVMPVATPVGAGLGVVLNFKGHQPRPIR